VRRGAAREFNRVAGHCAMPIRICSGPLAFLSMRASRAPLVVVLTREYRRSVLWDQGAACLSVHFTAAEPIGKELRHPCSTRPRTACALRSTRRSTTIYKSQNLLVRCSPSCHVAMVLNPTQESDDATTTSVCSERPLQSQIQSHYGIRAPAAPNVLIFVTHEVI
jgi:hypothetical protein